MNDLADEFAENGLHDVAAFLREHGPMTTLSFIDSEIEAAEKGDPYAGDLHNLEVARDRLANSVDHMETTTFLVEISTHSDDGTPTAHEIQMAIYRGIEMIGSEDAIHVERDQ